MLNFILKLLMAAGLGAVVIHTGWVLAGSATLMWQAPTTDVTGGPLTGLAGYKVYWTDGLCPLGSAPSSKDVGNVLTYTDTIPDTLSARCYAITAYDPSINESPKTSPVVKVQTPTTALLAAPTNIVFSAGTFTFTKNPLAAKTRLWVHEAGTPYDCLTQTFCGDVVSPKIVATMKWSTGYDCWMKSVDANGVEGTVAGISCSMPAAPIDTTPPASPDRLQVTRLDSNNVVLSALAANCKKGIVVSNSVPTATGWTRAARCAS